MNTNDLSNKIAELCRMIEEQKTTTDGWIYIRKLTEQEILKRDKFWEVDRVETVSDC